MQYMWCMNLDSVVVLIAKVLCTFDNVLFLFTTYLFNSELTVKTTIYYT